MGSAALSPARKVASAMPKDRVSVTIPMRALGRTGERVSAIGLGGFHLGTPDLPEAESLRIIRTARDAGGIRYIGSTGHKNPAIHLRMLETAAEHGFRFDTVQMPLNVMDAHFESFEKKVLPVLVKEGIGVLGMKPLGDRQIPASKTVSPIECLHYTMNLPTSVVITGCDSMEILEQAMHAARTFRTMSPDAIKALLAKTASAAQEGAFERYKTTHDFDSTVAHPRWLG